MGPERIIGLAAVDAAVVRFGCVGCCAVWHPAVSVCHNKQASMPISCWAGGRLSPKTPPPLLLPPPIPPSPPPSPIPPPPPAPPQEDKQRSTKSQRPSWRSSRASRRRASTSDTGEACPSPSPTSFFTRGRNSPVAAAVAPVPPCVGLSEEDAQAAATFVSRSSDSRQTPSQLYHNSLFGDHGSGSWSRP